MSPAAEDARNYIVIKKLPGWKEATDSKLKARSFSHYTLALPTRHNVFKVNYARRHDQMTSQGYNSVPWEPYKTVGHPLNLDVKDLVRSSLGQKSDLRDEGSRQPSKAEFDLQKDGQKTGNKENVPESGEETDTSADKKKGGKKGQAASSAKSHFSAASFVMKHRQNELQNIAKDLMSVRDKLTYVKMGRALFPMLQNEQEIAQMNDKLQKQSQQVKQGTQSDDVFDTSRETMTRQNEAMTRQNSASSRPVTISNSARRVSVARPTPALSSSRTSFASQMEASKGEVPLRPFTPVHTNISNYVDTDNATKSVWKQLCVLHWILFACNVAANVDNYFQHKVMIPLVACWNEMNPGGGVRDARIISQEHKNNNKWTKFTRKPSRHMISTRTKSRKKLLLTGHPHLLKRQSSFADLGLTQEGLSHRSQHRPPSERSTSHHHRHASDSQAAPHVRHPSETVTSPTRHESVTSRARRVSELSVIDADEPELQYAGAGNGLVRPSSPGQSSVATTLAGGTVISGSDFGDDDTSFTDMHSTSVADAGGSRREEESLLHERDYHEHLRKLLSTVQESVRSEMSRRELTALVVAEANKKLPVSVYEWARSSYFRIGKEVVNITRIVLPAATPVTDFTDTTAVPTTTGKSPRKPTVQPKIRPHTAAPTANRRESTLSAFHAPGKFAAATTTMTSSPTTKARQRPQSSPAKLAHRFTFKFNSGEKETKLGKIREKFDEINDTKALQLHNQLSELEKKRKQRMEVKFGTFTTTISMQRDLRGMRAAAHSKQAEESAKQKMRDQAVTCEWYSSLTRNLPLAIVADARCSLVLARLNRLGEDMTEAERGVTSEHFLEALRGLRAWELCAPHVIGAVDFVRERVVGMPARDFDEWLGMKIGGKQQAVVGADSRPAAVGADSRPAADKFRPSSAQVA